MKPRRVGRFTYSMEHLDDFPPPELFAVFAQCVVVRAECMWHLRQVHVTAVSSLFDEVSEGEIIPEYDWEISAATIRAVRNS